MEIEKHIMTIFNLISMIFCSFKRQIEINGVMFMGKIALNKARLPLLFGLFLSFYAILPSAYANTTYNIHGDSVDNSLTKQKALERKDQWNDTKSLRNKMNKRAEKEYSKIDKAIDDEDSCRRSSILTAYWEPVTRRCLDSRTGHDINH